MLKPYLDKINEQIDLTAEEASETLSLIMEGKANDQEIEQLLLGLAAKGERVSELVGFAKAMRFHSIKASLGRDGILDTCGTGGDGGKTFNISTAVAFIAAAAGIPVAKHGNRAVSGKSGSIDVLEALGIEIDISPLMFQQLFRQTNLLFLFAQLHHPAMKYVAPIRKKLQRRTIFNMLGPLTNPAGAQYQMIGVYQEQLTDMLAETLQQLGCQRGMVVYSLSGLDELSIDGQNKVTEIIDGKINSYLISPEDIGLRTYSIKDVQGGTPAENADIILRIFKGETGANRDIAVLNAGAAIYIANRSQSIAEGVKLAQQLLDSGSVYSNYQIYQNLSHEYRSLKEVAK